jgi:hypothetical protein
VTGVTHIPPPPPGPGVQTPFATPPTERDRKRLWIGLGIGGALLVLCCGGGLFGLGAFAINRADSLRSTAESVVTQYLEDTRRQNFDAAFDLLCAQEQSKFGHGDFAAMIRSRGRIAGFRVGTAMITGTTVIVSAAVDFESGPTRYPTYSLVEEQEPGNLRICGGE